MALSFNLGYQESISVHPTRRQNFAGKVYPNFPNIWEWLIYIYTYWDGSAVYTGHYGFVSVVTPKERFPQRKQVPQIHFTFPPKQSFTFAIDFVFCVIFVKIWQTPLNAKIIQFWLALPTSGFLALDH